MKNYLKFNSQFALPHNIVISCLKVPDFLFLEGGRLERELDYTKNSIGAGSDITNQIVIQTPKTGNNILTQESLKQHRDALVKASQITINMFGL